MAFVTEQQTDFTIGYVGRKRAQSFIRHDHDWLSHVATSCSYPSRNSGKSICFGTLSINGQRGYSSNAQPLDYRRGNVSRVLVDRISTNVLPSSFAQFLTRLEGQAMMHFSIVGLPARGLCFNRVHRSAMHWRVLPRPISSAIMQPY